MKPEINFGDWMKFNLVVGEVIGTHADKIKIDIAGKSFEINKKLDVEIGNKIIVGLNGNNLIIPLVGSSVVVPEKEIENGVRVGWMC